jgi:hypothetical protein
MQTRNAPIGERTAATIRSRLSLLVSTALGLSAGIAGTMSASAQDAAPPAVPAEQTAAAATQRNWKPQRFSWGHANLEGTFTSRDMGGIPLQRPDQFGTRQFLTAEEFRERATAGPSGFAAFVTQQSEDASRIELSALDSTETGTRVFGYTPDARALAASHLRRPVYGSNRCSPSAGRRSGSK